MSSDAVAHAIRELVIANRILAREDVIDDFGHVSLRHPERPDRYFLSRSRSPVAVTSDDIMEFELDGTPVAQNGRRMYSERAIHSGIYMARPDVRSVVHHHARSVIPFTVTKLELKPVFHMGSVMGPVVPMWDSQDEFGDTNMLVIKAEEGASLARAMGKGMMVLMRRHGATVASSNLRELVFRTIYGARNAEYQTQAKVVGKITQLSPGEIEKAGALPKQPNTVSRAWEYWATRLAKRGGMPPKVPGKSAVKSAAKRAPSKAAPARRSAAKKKKSTGGKKR